ncbi:MAG: hypothetical protein LUH06_04910, partial [Oscillospiraceae bacterium]|nr:hypothetical protein [Oscillospiraceae bacterium]
GVEYTNLPVLGSGINLCEQLEYLSANGKVIEFYDYYNADGEPGDDDVIDTIVIIEYSVGELTTCSTSGTVTKYKVDGNSTTFEYDSDDPDGSDAFVIGGSVSKNDIVSYVVTEDSDGEDVMYIYPITSVEGYFSTYSTGKFGSITVDGTRYTVGSGVYNADFDDVLGAGYTTAFIVNNSSTNTYTVSSDAITSVFGDTDEEVTVYLDQFGYAVYGDEGGSTTTTTNYVYVTDVSEDDYDEGDTIWKVKFVTTEGDTGTAFVQGDGATQEVFEHYWYKKSNNADSSGYYDFKSVDEGSTYTSAYGLLNNGTLKSSQSTIVDDVEECVGDNYSTVKANSSTTFIIRTKTSSGNVSYRVYYGLSRVPTYNGTLDDVYAYALIKNSTDYAVAVYINVGDISTSGDDDDEVIFLLTTSGTEGSGTEDGETYYTYNAIVNGEKTTIKGDDDDLALGNRGLVYYSKDNSSGWYTNFDEVYYENVDGSTTKYSKYTIDSGVSIDYDGGVLSWDDDSISLADDCVVYYIYGGGNTTTVGEGDLLEGDTRAAATIWTVNRSNTNQTAVEVYFWSNKSLA